MNTLEDHTQEVEMLTLVKPYVVSLCIMEHRALFGIVDARGSILNSDSVLMADYPDPSSFVFDVCDRLVPMMEQCGGIEKIKAMGISTCSGNNRSGCIESPANLDWKGNIPLAKMFQGSLGLPVTLQNDATTAAQGEAVFGAAHGLQNFVAVYINAGLGAGIYVNNAVVRGYNGRVGEIGHVTIFPGGRPCGCGKVGCLESYVSQRGILMNLQDMLKAHPEVNTPLRDIPMATLKVEDVVEAAEAGDRLALAVFRYTGNLLGKALVPTSSFINPEAFILCGWVGSLCGKFMQRAVLEALNEELFAQMKWKTRVLVSHLDLNEAPLLYASAEAWNSKGF